jgi:hypothetical protein
VLCRMWRTEDKSAGSILAGTLSGCGREWACAADSSARAHSVGGSPAVSLATQRAMHSCVGSEKASVSSGAGADGREKSGAACMGSKRVHVSSETAAMQTYTPCQGRERKQVSRRRTLERGRRRGEWAAGREKRRCGPHREASTGRHAVQGENRDGAVARRSGPSCTLGRGCGTMAGSRGG